MKKLQDVIRNFCEARGWTHATPASYAKSISIESAELLELFQWSEPSAVELIGNKLQLQNVRDELADVLIYSLDLATMLNLDAETIVRAKLRYNQRKYPVKKVRGMRSTYAKIKKEYRKKRL